MNSPVGQKSNPSDRRAVWKDDQARLARTLASVVLPLMAWSSHAISVRTTAVWMGTSIAVVLALNLFTSELRESDRRAQRAWDVLLMVGFLVLAWSLGPSGGESLERMSTETVSSSRLKEIPDSKSQSVVARALGASAPASGASDAARVEITERSTLKDLKKDDDPLTPVNALAAILAVVLAVVTLVATKTATDAQNAVRVEVEKLEALTRATEQARIAEASMLTAMLQGEALRLRELIYSDDQQEAAGASKLLQFFEPLSHLMHGMTRPNSQVSVRRMAPSIKRLATLSRLSPWGSLPDDVMLALTRDLLHETGQAVALRLATLRTRSVMMTQTEQELFDQLDELALNLERA